MIAIDVVARRSSNAARKATEPIEAPRQARYHITRIAIVIVTSSQSLHDAELRARTL